MKLTISLILFVFLTSQALAQFSEVKELAGSSNRRFFDFTNDGRMDIVECHSLAMNMRSAVILSDQDAEGNFNRSFALCFHDWEVPCEGQMENFDFNQDGLQDILIIGNKGIAIYQNVNGEILDFQYSSLSVDNETIATNMNYLTSFEDFNGDGLVDIVTKLQSGLWVFPGTSNIFQFGDAMYFETPAVSELIDFDLDGHMDVIGFVDETVHAFRGTGQGGFQESEDFFEFLIPFNNIHVDFDNDQLMDVFVVDDSLFCYHNLGGGDFEVLEIFDDESGIVQVVDINSDNVCEVIFIDVNSGSVFNHIAHYSDGEFISELMNSTDFAYKEFFDKNGDGYSDYFVTSGWYNSTSSIRLHNPEFSSWSPDVSFPSVRSAWGLPNGGMQNMFVNQNSEIYRIDEITDGYLTGVHKIKFTNDTIEWASNLMDLDNDGDLDFVYIAWDALYDQRVFLALHVGEGYQSIEVAQFNLIYADPIYLNDPFFDFNHDGYMDFMLMIDEQYVLFVNNGSGFDQIVQTQFTSLVYEVLNVNHEFAILHRSTMDEVEMQLLQADGSWLPIFQAPFSKEYGNGPPLINDYNGDGLYDLFIGGGITNLLISDYFNTPDNVMVFGNSYVENSFSAPFKIGENWLYFSAIEEMPALFDMGSGQILLTIDTAPFFWETGDVDGDQDIDMIFLNEDLFWVENMGDQATTVNMMVFLDSNENGILDSSEGSINVGVISAQTEGNSILFNDGDGMYQCSVSGSELEIQHNVSTNIWQHTTPNQASLVINGVDSVIHFGIIPVGEYFNCDVSASLANAKCNLEGQLFLNVSNTGNIPAECRVSINIPFIFSYVSSSIVPIINGNVLTFDCGLLNPGQDIQIQMVLNNPSEQEVGEAYIFSANGYTLQNNAWVGSGSSMFNGIVSCAYDPNDKTELTTLFTNNLYQIGQGLEYLVRFQNTGNAPATNIHIVDQLSTNLDLSTFEMIDASHEQHYSLSSSGELIVYFDNIMLADSFSNEIASHGFFKYRIQPVYTEEQGQEIYNTAFIYFDQNPPVLTNTTHNTITVLSVTDALAESKSITLFPNPNQGSFTILTPHVKSWQVEIWDIYGQLVWKEQWQGDTHKVALDSAAGIYLVKVSDTSGAEAYTARFIADAP